MQSRSVLFSLTMTMSLLANSAFAQKADGMFARTQDKITESFCGKSSDNLTTAYCRSGVITQVVKGEALWAVTALINRMSGQGETAIFEYTKAVKHLEQLKKTTLVSESHRRDLITEIEVNRANYTMTKNGARLNENAFKEIKKIKALPIVGADAAANILKAQELIVNEKEFNVIRMLNSRGYKIQRLFMWGGVVAAIDIGAQLIYTIANNGEGAMPSVASLLVVGALDQIGEALMAAEDKRMGRRAQ